MKASRCLKGLEASTSMVDCYSEQFIAEEHLLSFSRKQASLCRLIMFERFDAYGDSTWVNLCFRELFAAGLARSRRQRCSTSCRRSHLGTMKSRWDEKRVCKSYFLWISSMYVHNKWTTQIHTTDSKLTLQYASLSATDWSMILANFVLRNTHQSM